MCSDNRANQSLMRSVHRGLWRLNMSVEHRQSFIPGSPTASLYAQSQREAGSVADQSWEYSNGPWLLPAASPHLSGTSSLPAIISTVTHSSPVTVPVNGAYPAPHTRSSFPCLKAHTRSSFPCGESFPCCWVQLDFLWNFSVQLCSCCEGILRKWHPLQSESAPTARGCAFAAAERGKMSQ